MCSLHMGVCYLGVSRLCSNFLNDQNKKSHKFFSTITLFGLSLPLNAIFT